MRQTLFSIPHEIAGIPVFGFGWLLVLWVFFSFALVGWLVRRQGFGPETRSYLPVLITIAAAILLLLPLLEDANRGLPIRGYGVMMLLGVVAGVGLAARRAQHVGIDGDVVFSLAFWMFVAGILGARLFHVIEYWETSYRQENADGALALIPTMQAIINVPKGGLVVYGSLITGTLAVIWFVRRRKLPGLVICDVIAPGMVLGLALGRVGCLLNGCCFGGACDLPWAITFPPGSLPYESEAEHGWTFGVSIGVDRRGGLFVRRVHDGSEAERKGIQRGARILAIDGRRLQPKVVDGRDTSTGEQLEDLFHWKSAVTIKPLGATRAIYLRWSPSDRERAGGQTSPLEQLEGGFGIKIGKSPDGAAVIQHVEPYSLAAARGLRVGDTIQEIDGSRITSLSDAERLLGRKTQLTLQIEGDAASKELTWSPPARSPRLHPTQIYSAINALLICLFLLAYYPYRRRDGEVFALMITIYPITRILLEIIRTDEAPMFGTALSISQIVSVLLLLGVVGFWWYVLQQPKGQLWSPDAGQFATSKGR